MFCPKCGNADQTENSFCRNCGEFLVDTSSNFNLIYNFLGISTPEKQITVNLIINFFGLLLSVLLLGFLMGYFDAGENKNPSVPTPKIIYFVYTFLLLISAWQLLGVVFAFNLRSKFNKGKANKKSEENDGVSGNKTISAKKRESLAAADLNDIIIPMVTEGTTKNLADKVNRSTQTKQ
jgi:hypothetical protein